MISRAKLRGCKLDEDCKKAHTTSHEYGSNDGRVFCFGLYGDLEDELRLKCKQCKALVWNAEPYVKEKI